MLYVFNQTGRNTCWQGSVVDLCTETAAGLLELNTGRLEPRTKKSCVRLLVRLYAIWYASRFGSFDDRTRRGNDPYFYGPPPSISPISFSMAAQHYGMSELRRRFPQAEEAMLQQALTWPLELLQELIEHLSRNAPLEA